MNPRFKLFLISALLVWMVPLFALGGVLRLLPGCQSHGGGFEGCIVSGKDVSSLLYEWWIFWSFLGPAIGPIAGLAIVILVLVKEIIFDPPR